MQRGGEDGKQTNWNNRKIKRERNERLNDGREERVLKVNGKCVLL